MKHLSDISLAGINLSTIDLAPIKFGVAGGDGGGGAPEPGLQNAILLEDNSGAILLENGNYLQLEMN